MISPHFDPYSAERIAKASERQALELKRIRLRLTDLVTWIRRMALAAMLWATGIGLHLNADQIAEIIVTIARRGK